MVALTIPITLARTLALIACLGLSACATLDSLSIPDEPSEEHIATLLENHQFDKALQAVDKWELMYPNDAKLPKQRKKIIQSISRFEQRALEQAKQLDDKGQWQEARSAYENALSKLPSSQTLQDAYSEFSLRRLEYIKGLKEALDVAQAKHWLNIQSDIEALYSVAPNDTEARTWKAEGDASREQLARRLIDYGLAHEKNNHFGTAALRYDLAYTLAPSEFTKPYYERAAKTFAKRKAKQKQRAREDQQRQQSRLSQLAEEFDEQLAKEEFRLARQTLGAMEAIDEQATQVRERRQKLDQQRAIAFDRAVLDGNRFYTKGEFKNAINAWQRALQLDPDNKEIKENIQRAEKFRENLERLKQGS